MCGKIESQAIVWQSQAGKYVQKQLKLFVYKRLKIEKTFLIWTFFESEVISKHIYSYHEPTREWT